jgi:hypothetical protein
MLMIATALAIAAGRIALVISPEGDTAFLSANDRSRWATVAALVEDGTYAIDRLIAIRDATGKRRPWQTIDRVRHTASDGRMHDYSSKPPLFSTLVAGVYGVVRGVTGASLTENPIGVARVILALVNLPLLATFLVAVWRSIRVGYGEWAALAGLATASFGSMVLPMSITLGNHLPAAAATAVVLAIYLARTRATGEQGLSGGLAAAAVAGGAAAFTVSCELPALSMFVLWGILFWLQDRRSTWHELAGASDADPALCPPLGRAGDRHREGPRGGHGGSTDRGDPRALVRFWRNPPPEPRGSNVTAADAIARPLGDRSRGRQPAVRVDPPRGRCR